MNVIYVIHGIYVPHIRYIICSAQIIAPMSLITYMESIHVRSMRCSYNLFYIIYLYKLYNYVQPLISVMEVIYVIHGIYVPHIRYIICSAQIIVPMSLITYMESILVRSMRCYIIYFI